MILNEDQILLRNSVAEFLNREAPIGALRALRDNDNSPAWEPSLWAGLRELGAPAAAQSELEGGLGFGWIGMGALMLEVGRRLSATPLLSSAIHAQAVIRYCANEEQAQRILPSIMSGETVATVAAQEGPQFHLGGITTRREGNLLSGSKRMVMDAGGADYFLVSAIDHAEQQQIAMIRADTPGIEIQCRKLMDGRQYASIEFLSAEADEWLAGETLSEGFTRAYDQATILLCCEMLGGCRELLERTVSYLQEREQFDVKIGTFQALQHRLARAFCDLELAAASLYSALCAMDEGTDNLSESASRVKTLIGDSYQHLSNEATQMHGGMGVTDEMDIGLFMKRSRVCNQLLGSSAFHRDRFATLRGY